MWQITWGKNDSVGPMNSQSERLAILAGDITFANAPGNISIANIGIMSLTNNQRA
jgi:hypothetical protein